MLGAFAAPLAVAGTGVLSSLLGGGKSTTISQVPLETPEQQAARKMLLDFSQTGKFGSYTAGTPYGGSYGDFSMSGLERSGSGALSGYLSSAAPLFSKATSTLSDLFSGNWNPNDPNSGFAPFKDAVLRAQKSDIGNIKAGSAFNHNLYSTATSKAIAQTGVQTGNALQGKLAEMFQQYLDRKYSAIPQAVNLATGAADQAFQYGGLERGLNTASDQAALSEWLRQRQDALMPLNSAATVAGQNTQFGVPSVTYPGSNPFSAVAGSATNAGITELIRQLMQK